jgi:hypothetical protein
MPLPPDDDILRTGLYQDLGPFLMRDSSPREMTAPRV